jgi:hypothetical protein
MPASPLWLWSDLAWRSGEMLIASMQVIQHRTQRMAAAGVSPSARDRREFGRMGREKIDAAAEAALAVATQWAGSSATANARAATQMITGMTALMSVLSSRTPGQYLQRQGKLLRAMTDSAMTASQLSTSGARLAQRALKPLHARATANAKRLSGR